MINIVWLILIISGFIVAILTGNVDQLSEAIFQATTDSVQISIKLLGPMALWLGIMNIAKKAGLTELLARIITPFFRFFFPDIPDNNPAKGAILFNLSANILGLGNSATPMGIKAMQELQKINPDQNKASPAMCTLLAINTSSLTLVPATIISLRAATGSSSPAIITISTIFATSVSTITALLLDRTFRLFTGK